MDKPDPALRPSQPPDPEAQMRWLYARQTEATLALAATVQRLVESVDQLCRRIASLDSNVADLEARMARA